MNEPNDVTGTSAELNLDAGWSLTEAAFSALLSAVAARPPRHILEFGSGRSTVRLALAFPDAKIVSLEHDPQEFARTTLLLHRHGVKGRVDLRLAPLVDGAYGYDLGTSPSFDVVLVDGPPGHVEGGREMAGRAGLKLLAAGGRLFLDDYERSAEQEAAKAWRGLYSPTEMQETVLFAGRKSLLMIEKLAHSGEIGET